MPILRLRSLSSRLSSARTSALAPLAVSPNSVRGTRISPALASITAHEIFHLWNVKRMRPADMVPYRYDRAQPTTWLWVSEGITDYYADLSQDPGDFNFAGFMPSGGEIGPGDRSFNLGESELTIAANIDPYFMGSMTAAITPEISP